MRKAKIYCPDTSALISLLEEDDPNHEKAITEFGNIKVRELFIPDVVTLEFIETSSRNIKKIIADIMELIEKFTSPNLSLSQINIFIERTKANFLKIHKGTEAKLLKDIKKVRDYVKKIYSSPSCVNGNINIKNVLSYLSLFKNNVDFEYMTKSEVLRVIGFKSLSITTQANECIRKSLTSDNFKDLNDNLIINEVLRYSLSSNEFNFYLLLFDKEFSRQAIRRKRQLKCRNLTIKLIN